MRNGSKNNYFVLFALPKNQTDQKDGFEGGIGEGEIGRRVSVRDHSLFKPNLRNN
jgi:hypothetical protein